MRGPRASFKNFTDTHGPFWPTHLSESILGAYLFNVNSYSSKKDRFGALWCENPA